MNFLDLLRHPRAFGPKHRPYLLAAQIADWLIREVPALSQEDALAMADFYKKLLFIEHQMEQLFDIAFRKELTGYCKVAAEKGIAGLAIRSQINDPNSVTEWVIKERSKKEWREGNPAIPQWRRPPLPPHPPAESTPVVPDSSSSG